MIRYALSCSCGHQFQNWFDNMDSADAELARGAVACPSCGGTEVGKALMAPAVGAAPATAAMPPMSCGQGACGMCPAMAAE